MKKFFHQLLTDDGKWSFGRIGSGLIIVFSIYWITFLVLKNHAVPDVSGLAILIGVPYGLSKGAAVAAGFQK